jgi:hypothetical protein
MPEGKEGNREGFAPREIGSIRKADLKDHFAAMGEAGATVNTINKTLSAAKTVLNFALDQELIERNVLARYRPYEIDRNDTSARKALRGTCSEAEVRQLPNVAKPFDHSPIAWASHCIPATLPLGYGSRPGSVRASHHLTCTARGTPSRAWCAPPVRVRLSRMMGHSRSTLVDQVYAHSMQSGLASAAESGTARALGIKPQLRVIQGGNQRDVRQPLAETPIEAQAKGSTR